MPGRQRSQWHTCSWCARRCLLAHACAGVKRDPKVDKRDLLSVKRDLASVKRDVPSAERDLTSVKRDIKSVKRDLTSVKRDLTSVKRDPIRVKRDLQSAQRGLSKATYLQAHPYAQTRTSASGPNFPNSATHAHPLPHQPRAH